MSNDIFAEVRDQVTAQEAAERYGVEVRRGWTKCPFHGEKTASLKFYQNGGFYCFGCHRGGSSIDFVSNLFSITPLEAVKKINEDFSLGLTPGKLRSREDFLRRERALWARQAFRDWREAAIRLLGDVILRANKALEDVRDAGTLDVLTPGQVAALNYREPAEDLQDTLLSGTLEAQLEVYKNRKEIATTCRSILEACGPLRKKPLE